MKILKNYLHDLSILIWLVFILELLIFLLALIVGHVCGYRSTFIAFGVMGALLGIPLLIFIFLLIVVNVIIDIVKKKRKK